MEPLTFLEKTVEKGVKKQMKRIWLLVFALYDYVDNKTLNNWAKNNKKNIEILYSGFLYNKSKVLNVNPIMWLFKKAKQHNHPKIELN